MDDNSPSWWPQPQGIGVVRAVDRQSSSVRSIDQQKKITKSRPQKDDQIVNCPRCNSVNTKFCYYNNYSLSQPRYFCKTCRRYWTAGGSLRNVPVGGGSRKNRRSSITATSSSSSLLHQGHDLNSSFPNPNTTPLLPPLGLFKNNSSSICNNDSMDMVNCSLMIQPDCQHTRSNNSSSRSLFSLIEFPLVHNQENHLNPSSLNFSLGYIGDDSYKSLGVQPKSSDDTEGAGLIFPSINQEQQINKHQVIIPSSDATAHNEVHFGYQQQNIVASSIESGQAAVELSGSGLFWTGMHI